MTRGEQDKVAAGAITVMLIALGFLLSCCGQAPTEPNEPPPLAAGDTLSALISGNTVTWMLADSTYRFEQSSPLFGLVSWEAGRWWLDVGWDDTPSVWFARREGAVLTDSRDDTWAALAPLSRPYAIVRSRDAVGLRNSSGSVIYYRVR